jgi:hypothetical protein
MGVLKYAFTFVAVANLTGFWFSDKPLPQSDLATTLSKQIHFLLPTKASLWIRGKIGMFLSFFFLLLPLLLTLPLLLPTVFFETIQREWFMLDRLRLASYRS